MYNNIARFINLVAITLAFSAAACSQSIQEPQAPIEVETTMELSPEAMRAMTAEDLAMLGGGDMILQLDDCKRDSKARCITEHRRAPTVVAFQ